MKVTIGKRLLEMMDRGPRALTGKDVSMGEGRWPGELGQPGHTEATTPASWRGRKLPSNVL